MSRVTYNAGTMTIGVDGLDDVSAVLGDLRKKTPAVVKVAINSMARQARKMMIAQAKARYAVNSVGRRHLKDLVQRKKASNSSLNAELHVASMRNDLGYFKTSPAVPTHFSGRDWVRGPSTWRGKVLKSSSMKALPGKEGNLSKAFLAEFTNKRADGTSNNHIGMVQRMLNSSSKEKKTKNGYPRWKNKQGKVEKLVTLGSPSITAMHHTIWPLVEPEASEYLQNRLMERAQQVVEAAARRKV